MDWGYAIGRGIEAGAGVGAGMIDARMKDDMQAQAEQRAANLKLDTTQRLMAIDEAMKSRAAERFSGVVRDKMAEPVPIPGEPVSKTGITRESAKIALNNPDAMGIQAGPDEMNRWIKRAQDTLTNPQATDQQREDARGLMEQIGQQMAAQEQINAKAVEGQTRPRTLDEAKQAGVEQAWRNGDAGAVIAGTGMLASGNKIDLEEKKLASREKIASEANDRKERADNLRFEGVMARIEAMAAGKNGKGGDTTALRQNVELLKELGYGPDKIEKFIFDKKEIPVEDIAAKLLAADKFGELTPEKASEKAHAIKSAAAKMGSAAGKTEVDNPTASGKDMTYNPITRTFK